MQLCYKNFSKLGYWVLFSIPMRAGGDSRMSGIVFDTHEVCGHSIVAPGIVFDTWEVRSAISFL